MLYIGRERAASEIVAEHMPEDPQEARTWMDGHERNARKNARLCDKIRLALPRELSEAERAKLVQDYMGELSKNRVPWYAAIHQSEKDAHNPHAHVVIVDRDIDSGKRVLGLSDSIRDRQKKGLPGPSAVEWVRERWEHHANTALERAGHEARIDRRSLKDQGIEREPQIHIGPRAQKIETFVKRPESKRVPDPTPRHPDRVIDYPMIDAGRTRRERNAEIVDINLERAARSKDFETRVAAQFEREQRVKDRLADTQVIAANRRRTLEVRRIKRSFAKNEQDIRARRDVKSRLVRAWLKQSHAPEMRALRQRHAEDGESLKERHSRVLGRLWAALDVSGRTKARRAQERSQLVEQHKEQRQTTAARMREDRMRQLEAVRMRYSGQMDEVRDEKARKLSTLRARQELERRKDDTLLQRRAAEREQDRQTLQRRIDKWKQKEREVPRRAVEKPRKPDPVNKRQSALDQAGSAKDAFAREQSDRLEARKARIRERFKSAQRQDGQSRDQSGDHDVGYDRD
jgi:hypothetical protein